MKGIDKAELNRLLHETLSGTVAVFSQIIQLFLNETPKSISELKAKHEKNDIKSVVHISHTLKSNGLSLGAMHFAKLCGQIEDLGRKKQLSGVLTLIHQLEKEFAHCNRDLQEEYEAIQAKSA